MKKSKPDTIRGLLGSVAMIYMMITFIYWLLFALLGATLGPAIMRSDATGMESFLECRHRFSMKSPIPLLPTIVVVGKAIDQKRCQQEAE